MKLLKRFGFFVVLLFVIFSCEKDESGEGRTMISQQNDNESHKNGQDCLRCHKSGGDGKGWFVAAGSVYNSTKQTPYPNGTVKLYSEANGKGTLIGSIEVDGKGNFYSTENIDFEKGLYTIVTGTDGKIKTMIAPITTGACNSCHGNSTDNIWIE